MLSSINQDPGHSGEKGPGKSRRKGFAPGCVTTTWPSTATVPETPGTTTLAGSPQENGAWAVSRTRMGTGLGFEWIRVFSGIWP